MQPRPFTRESAKFIIAINTPTTDFVTPAIMPGLAAALELDEDITELLDDDAAMLEDEDVFLMMGVSLAFVSTATTGFSQTPGGPPTHFWGATQSLGE